MKRLIIIVFFFINTLRAEISVDLAQGSISQSLRLLADAHNLTLICPADLSSQVVMRIPDSTDVSSTLDVLAQISTQPIFYTLTSGVLHVQRRTDPLDYYNFTHTSVPENLPVGVQRISDRLVSISGTLKERAATIAALKLLDADKRSVLVTVTITEVSLGDSRNLGVTWPSNVSASLDPKTGTVDLGKISLDLAASKSGSHARTVANPSVSVQSGSNASVAIGDQYPLPKYTLNQQTGQMLLGGYDYKDIGVKLTVSPEVFGDHVVLTLTQDVSSVSGQTTVQGTSLPTISTRSASTVLRLKSGQSTTIAGLLSSSDYKASSKVLGASKIPVLGSLFRSSQNKKSTTELVLTITAVVQ